MFDTAVAESAQRLAVFRGDVCFEIAEVVDGEYGRKKVTLCGDDRRVTTILWSRSNIIRIELANPKLLQSIGAFVFHYQGRPLLVFNNYTFLLQYNKFFNKKNVAERTQINGKCRISAITVSVSCFVRTSMPISSNASSWVWRAYCFISSPLKVIRNLIRGYQYNRGYKYIQTHGHTFSCIYIISFHMIELRIFWHENWVILQNSYRPT